MNDEAKQSSPDAPGAGSSTAAAAPATPPADKGAGDKAATPAAKPRRWGVPDRPLDWGAMVPADATEVALDLLKFLVGWAVLANVIAVARGTTVSAGIAVGGAVGGLALVALWRAYLISIEGYGARAIGKTYAALGIAAAAATFWFAGSSGSVHESRELRALIGLVGLGFLYPAALGVYVAITGKEPEGANPLGIPFQPSWFKTAWTLYAKEMRSFFTTAVPYLVFFLFMALNGVLFFALIRYLTQPGGQPPPPQQIVLDNILFWISLWFICPALTMRLVAEERRMGTIESLLTAPVTDIQVILSKFAAAFSFFAIMLSTTLLYLAILALHSKEWDWGPVFAGYVGIALVGGLFLAVGLFWSTLTQSQLIAFLFGAVTNILLFFTNILESFVKDEKLRELTKYLSLHEHYREMLLGVVTTRSLVFFGSLIVFFLFCSVRGLETQKWK